MTIFSNIGYERYHQQPSVEEPLSTESFATHSSAGPSDSEPKEIRQRNYVYAEIDRYRIREMCQNGLDSSMNQGWFYF